MKRALAMALGAMMVAGSAAPATAASHIDFSGYYRVNYMLDVNRGMESEAGSFTDHYFDDRLLINMTFSPTDEIAVHWQLRGPNRERWGAGTRAGNLVTQHVYGEIKQDWGTVLVGRLDNGLDVYGLASLGYQPGFGPYQNYGPFDRADVIDAVRYTNRWDNGFGLMVQYAKMEAGGYSDYTRTYTDSTGDTVVLPAGTHANKSSDEDADRVQAEVSYMWDGGGASLGLMYDRNATGGYHGTSAAYVDRLNNVYLHDKTTAFFVNPAIMHSWGNFSVHFEGMAGWGSTDAYNRGLGKSRSADADGYGAYLDFDYNYGPGNVNLAGWWVSGSDLGDRDSGSLVDLVGGNFYPLLVAYGYTGNGAWRIDLNNNEGSRKAINAIGVANNAFENFIAPNLGAGSTFLDTGNVMPAALATQSVTRFVGTTFNEGTDANHWAVSLSGNHAFTDDITMHYAVAYLALNNPNYRVVDSWDGTTAKMKEQDKDLGFEVDLGFQFQLLDNLSFTSSFGYMFTGDAYKELRGYNENTATGLSKAKWRDGDDTYVWYNTLQFDF